MEEIRQDFFGDGDEYGPFCYVKCGDYHNIWSWFMCSTDMNYTLCSCCTTVQGVIYIIYTYIFIWNGIRKIKLYFCVGENRAKKKIGGKVSYIFLKRKAEWSRVTRKQGEGVVLREIFSNANKVKILPFLHNTIYLSNMTLYFGFYLE